MKVHHLVSALALVAATPALGQTTPAPTAAQIEALQAQIDALQAQVEALKKAVAAAPAAAPAPVATAAAKPETPPLTARFSPSPRFSDDKGFSFKVRGRLQLDSGYVENPGDTVAGKALGYANRMRRGRLGVDGALPGGFEYRAEVEFSNNAVSWTDAYINYKAKGSPLSVKVGHFYPPNSLETINSSNQISFLERASFHEAFGYSRRLGIAGRYESELLSATLGVFGNTINDVTTNDESMIAGRVIFHPKLGDAETNFAINFNSRRFDSSALGLRYRTRPSTTLTSVRFVDTAVIGARGDRIIGLEAAVSKGPWHVASEAQWLSVDGIRPGTTLTGGDTLATGARLLGADADLFGAYAEIGYSFTGEHRPLADGEFGRPRVRKGFDKGGWGGLQLNLRYETLDLEDRGANLNGGQQDALLMSLIWRPSDYIRFLVQGGRNWITGGPLAGTVRPTDTRSLFDRDYTVDFFGVRSQVDF
ncbi:MAG: DUF3138 family protein [Alphaproteobacteria bacterium]|nr:DUF3138 family protein [Alphaproteobacteria bacterium]